MKKAKKHDREAANEVMQDEHGDDCDCEECDERRPESLDFMYTSKDQPKPKKGKLT